MPFKKGDPNINRKGPPRKPEIELLRLALEKAKQEKGIGFLEHFVFKAYANPNVAIALAKKLIPDKIKGEGFGSNTTIYDIIAEIRQARIARTVGSPPVELDNGHGLHERRTRFTDPGEEVPSEKTSGDNL
jgi:hypothetical protein